jgi:hypothetical protein
MKALAISMVAGAALCSVIAAPASAVPMSNVATAASELALGQNVRYVRSASRYRVRGGYPGYARDCSGYGYGPSSPCYP